MLVIIFCMPIILSAYYKLQPQHRHNQLQRFSRLQLSSITELIASAKKFLGDNSEDSKVLLLAEHFRDSESELEKRVLKNEFEKKYLELGSEFEKTTLALKLGKEFEKKALEQKLIFDQRCIEAKYKRDMAELSQRVVLEGLFRKVALFLENNTTVANRTTSLRSALRDSSLEPFKKKNILSGMQAKMTAINEALQNDAIREEAWVLLNFPLSLTLPTMSSSLLYGDVSAAVHLPNFKAVFISSDAPQSWVDFYKCAVLSLGGQSKIDVYDEGQSAYGAQLLDP